MPPPSHGCEASTPASIRAMWAGPAPGARRAGGPAAGRRGPATGDGAAPGLGRREEGHRHDRAHLGERRERLEPAGRHAHAHGVHEDPGAEGDRRAEARQHRGEGVLGGRDLPRRRPRAARAARPRRAGRPAAGSPTRCRRASAAAGRGGRRGCRASRPRRRAPRCAAPPGRRGPARAGGRGAGSAGAVGAATRPARRPGRPRAPARRAPGGGDGGRSRGDPPRRRGRDGVEPQVVRPGHRLGELGRGADHRGVVGAERPVGDRHPQPGRGGARSPPARAGARWPRRRRPSATAGTPSATAAATSRSASGRTMASWYEAARSARSRSSRSPASRTA